MTNMDKQLLLGLIHLYDPDTDTTTVSWAYRDEPELEYFILEVYDEVSRSWKAYDNRLGVIQKDRN